MNIEKRKSELVKEFTPMLRKSTMTYKVWIGFLVAVLAVGMYAFYLQYTKGHEVTGMRDNVVWGIYIINFIFMNISDVHGE